MDLAAIADKAEIVVVGEVDSSQVSKVAGSVYTFATISVDETLKGAPGATVRVAVPGGARASGRFQVSEIVAGAPLIPVDTTQLLFLEANAALGAYQIVGFNQGAFLVLEDVSAGARSASAVGASGERITLDDARAAVRASD